MSDPEPTAQDFREQLRRYQRSVTQLQLHVANLISRPTREVHQTLQNQLLDVARERDHWRDRALRAEQKTVPEERRQQLTFAGTRIVERFAEEPREHPATIERPMPATALSFSNGRGRVLRLEE